MIFSFTDYLTGKGLSLAPVADGKLQSAGADCHLLRLLLPPSALVVEVFGRLPFGLFPADSVVRPRSPRRQAPFPYRLRSPAGFRV